MKNGFEVGAGEGLAAMRGWTPGGLGTSLRERG